QLARLSGLFAAIGAVKTSLGLIAATVVVYDRDGCEIPPHCRLHLGEVVPESSVARENNDRPLRARGLCSYPSRKRPTKVPGAAHIALCRCAQIVETTHPHSGMAGIDDDDGIVGHMLGQLATDARRMNRHRIRFKHWLVFGAPF